MTQTHCRWIASGAEGEYVVDLDPERRKALALVIKALSHPTRLLLVEALAQGEQRVRELTELAQADISTVSKHLSVLKRAGLVRDRKAGSSVYYRITDPCILDFFDCAARVVDLPGN